MAPCNEKVGGCLFSLPLFTHALLAEREYDCSSPPPRPDSPPLFSKRISSFLSQSPGSVFGPGGFLSLRVEPSQTTASFPFLVSICCRFFTMR